MGGLWAGWPRIWLLAAALVGPGALVALALTAWRRGARRAWPARASIAEVGAVLTTLPWVLMILHPASPPPGSTMAYLVPFSDLWTQLTTYTPANMAVQIIRNLAVLFGFGVFAPIRFAALAGLDRLFLAAAAVALTLEVLQHVLTTGRVFSVDDVIVNAAGAVLGGLCSRRWWAPNDRLASGA